MRYNNEILVHIQQIADELTLELYYSSYDWLNDFQWLVALLFVQIKMTKKSWICCWVCSFRCVKYANWCGTGFTAIEEGILVTIGMEYPLVITEWAAVGNVYVAFVEVRIVKVHIPLSFLIVGVCMVILVQAWLTGAFSTLISGVLKSAEFWLIGTFSGLMFGRALRAGPLSGLSSSWFNWVTGVEGKIIKSKRIRDFSVLQYFWNNWTGRF